GRALGGLDGGMCPAGRRQLRLLRRLAPDAGGVSCPHLPHCPQSGNCTVRRRVLVKGESIATVFLTQTIGTSPVPHKQGRERSPAPAGSLLMRAGGGWRG